MWAFAFNNDLFIDLLMSALSIVKRPRVLGIRKRVGMMKYICKFVYSFVRPPHQASESRCVIVNIEIFPFQLYKVISRILEIGLFKTIK